MKLLYTVQNNVMYKYTFYHPLYSVRVSISYYVLHVVMLVLLIDHSSKYKSYASEPSLYSGTATHACFGSTFPAAGCECIHLTYQSACSLYRYSADIRTLHGVRSRQTGFFSLKKQKYENKNAQRVENDQIVSTQNSTSRSTRERNG